MFQEMYDFFKRLKSPKWFLVFYDYVMIVIVKPFLEAAGDAALEGLRRLVIKASQKDWTNEEKFQWVLSQSKDIFITYTDSMLRLLVEMVVAELKKKGLI